VRAVGDGDPDAERRGARRHAPPAAFYADINDGSPWGVGWLNNPVNPRYPADRNPFLETNCIMPGTDPLCSSAIDDQMAGVGLMVDNVERVIRARPRTRRGAAHRRYPRLLRPALQ
jgi:hypothetical protein